MLHVTGLLARVLGRAKLARLASCALLVCLQTTLAGANSKSGFSSHELSPRGRARREFTRGAAVALFAPFALNRSHSAEAHDAQRIAPLDPTGGSLVSPARVAHAREVLARHLGGLSNPITHTELLRLGSTLTEAGVTSRPPRYMRGYTLRPPANFVAAREHIALLAWLSREISQRADSTTDGATNSFARSWAAAFAQSWAMYSTRVQLLFPLYMRGVLDDYEDGPMSSWAVQHEWEDIPAALAGNEQQARFALRDVFVAHFAEGIPMEFRVQDLEQSTSRHVALTAPQGVLKQLSRLPLVAHRIEGASL